MSRPGIVLVSQFTTHDAKDKKGNQIAFGGFVGYINREDAKKTETEKQQEQGYIKYMMDEQKSNGIFDFWNDSLDEKQVNRKKWIFDVAQNNEGIMWQQVLSFDNDYLKKHNFLTENNELDDRSIQHATRKMMTSQLKERGMLGNVEWSASIHRNTDNIHVHVAYVEKNIKTKRGKIKQGVLDKSKASFLQAFINRSIEKQTISSMQEKVLSNMKYTHEASRIVSELQRLSQVLPKSGRMQYHSTNMDLYRTQLDTSITRLLHTVMKDEYQAFKESVQVEEAFYLESYGEGNRHLYEKYLANKKQELYGKVGNVLLSGVKDYREQEKVYKLEQITQKNAKKKLKARANHSKQHHDMSKKILQKAIKEMQHQIKQFDMAIIGGDWK